MVKIWNIIIVFNFWCDNSNILEIQYVKPLFLNMMQFILPFYDENCRGGSILLKYEKVNVGKWRIKKYIYIFLAPSPLLPQRQRDCPHSVGISQGATLHIVAQLHLLLPPPPFLKFLGPHFPNFFIILPRKNKPKNMLNLILV